MNRPRIVERWGYSLLLLAGYLAVFHLWFGSGRAWILATGLAIASLMSWGFARAALGSYFLNRWDALGHAFVILDVVLEAFLIREHDHLGFYLCAAAFAVVLGGYRAWLWRGVDRRSGPQGGRAIVTGGREASGLDSTPMSNDAWVSEFRNVYARGVDAWRAGRKSPASMFSEPDQAFLHGIGCTAQEAFDFVDDFIRYGEPSFEDALEVASIRRDFFLNQLGGVHATTQTSMDDLPPKAAAVDGISWLPRIIVKARLKLRGEMPGDLMYGCGGDRQFLASIRMSLPAFLKLVRDCGSDDRKIIDAVKRSAGRA